MPLMTFPFWLKRQTERTLDFLFPEDVEDCALCNRPLIRASHQQAHAEASVCLFCLQDAMKLNQAVVRYLQPASGHPPWQHPEQGLPVICTQTYQSLVRDAIRHWKYDGAIHFTPWFNRWMEMAYESFMATQNIEASVIVPVPTSSDRYRKRGYHHVALLGKQLSQSAGLPMRHWLQRAASDEFTQSQTAKNLAERMNSLQGKYTVVSQAQITGHTILLLDDVMTTGSTLITCAEELYRRGARVVIGMVIAQVE